MDINEKMQQLFEQIVNEHPKTKLQKIYNAFSWQINSPVLDITVNERSYNSSLLLTILTCLIKGKMLLLGPSGTGKSTIVETAARLIYGDTLQSLQAATIHCYPGLTLEELAQSFTTRSTDDDIRGIEQISILFMDDLSSLNIETKTILNTLFEEGIIIHNNARYELAEKPLFATSNSLDFCDVRSKALQDRFHISVIPTGINPAWIYSIVAKMKFRNVTKLSLFLTDEELAEILYEIDNINIDTSLLAKLEFFISELAYCEEISSDIHYKNKAFSFLNSDDACENICTHCAIRKQNEHIICKEIKGAVSTRALESCVTYFKAAAWLLSDHNNITEDIVEAIIPFVFLHRIQPSAWAKNSNDHLTRIPWIRNMWKNTLKTFERFEEDIAEYQILLAQLYGEDDVDEKKLREDAETLKSKLMKIDSPAKYNYIATLLSRLHDFSQHNS